MIFTNARSKRSGIVRRDDARTGAPSDASETSGSDCTVGVLAPSRGWLPVLGAGSSRNVRYLGGTSCSQGTSELAGATAELPPDREERWAREVPQRSLAAPRPGPISSKQAESERCSRTHHPDEVPLVYLIR